MASPFKFSSDERTNTTRSRTLGLSRAWQPQRGTSRGWQASAAAPCSALRLTRPVPVQSHCPALQFGLPPTFHREDVGGCRRCARNLQNRHLIVARVAALETYIAAVASVDIVLPTAPKARFTSRRANILLLGLRTCQQVDSTRRPEGGNPALRHIAEL